MGNVTTIRMIPEEMNQTSGIQNERELERPGPSHHTCSLIQELKSNKQSNATQRMPQYPLHNCSCHRIEAPG